MKYVTKMLAANMLSQLIESNGLVRIRKKESLDLLKNLVDFRVCINNDGLIYSLNEKLGLDLEKHSISKVFLVSGDYLILINPNEEVKEGKGSNQSLNIEKAELEVYYVKRDCLSEDEMNQIVDGLYK